MTTSAAAIAEAPERVERVEVAWDRPVFSSWIERVGFARVVTDRGRIIRVVTVQIDRELFAYEAPPWALGLMLAANAAGRSVGRIYLRYVKPCRRLG